MPVWYIHSELDRGWSTSCRIWYSGSNSLFDHGRSVASARRLGPRNTKKILRLASSGYERGMNPRRRRAGVLCGEDADDRSDDSEQQVGLDSEGRAGAEGQ